MFCSKCGAQNEAGAQFCASCGSPMAAAGPTPGAAPAQPSTPPPGAAAPGSTPVAPIHLIPNYLVQSILVTLFCCLPFGIVAIVKAAGVSKWQGLGNYDMAMKSSLDAKMWCWVAFGTGLVVVLIYFAVVFLGVLGTFAGLSAASRM